MHKAVVTCFNISGQRKEGKTDKNDRELRTAFFLAEKTGSILIESGYERRRAGLLLSNE